jgi:hypothetical protein
MSNKTQSEKIQKVIDKCNNKLKKKIKVLSLDIVNKKKKKKAD